MMAICKDKVVLCSPSEESVETAVINFALAPYAPKWVFLSLRDGWGEAEAPFAERRRAAVLFLDIAGFTSVSERLSRRGSRGAEELSELLNGYFAVLIEVIYQYGGDVVAFAGDGLVAIWENDDTARATQIASRCGLALQDALKQWGKAAATPLQLRIAVDAGEVDLCRMGGFDGQWHHLVVGTPIQRVGAAYRKADAGDVILCETAWRTAATSCEGEVVGELLRLRNVTALPSPVRAFEHVELPVGLERFIPRIVVDRMPYGSGRWLAEFRNLSVVYINLHEFSQGDELSPDLQHSVVDIQRIATRHEGTVHNILMDDKGFSVVLVFGLPPLAHQDDPLRAIEAALAIKRDVEASAIRTSMGIASGRLFCGDYGSRSRRSYSVIGPAINLAARLMEAAENDVYCDSVTASEVKGSASFAVLPPLHIKGLEERVSAFRPIKIESHRAAGRMPPLIGRDSERVVLREVLEDFQRGHGSLVVIEGEAGIGKSRLLFDLAAEAKARGCHVIQSFASSTDKSTPYFAWRSVLLQLLDIKPDADVTRARGRLIESLHDQATLLSWAPLLGDIIQLEMATTELTDQISGSARAASIEELVVYLLKTVSAGGHAALIFDDLHWFDSASVGLLAAVCRRMPQLLVLTSRRPADPARQPVALPPDLNLIKIRLDGLSRDSVGELIRQRLRVAELPTILIDLVHRRAAGNPFYCEELALALRDTGGIVVTRGTVRVLQTMDAGSHRALSASLEGAIVSRVDTLPQMHQMILKIASAFDAPFTPVMLTNLCPDELPLSEIADALDRLVDHDLLRLQAGDGGTVYEFRHAITQEVIYNLLSFAQRRTLHRDIANYIERTNRRRIEPLYARLAQHWELAEELLLAIGYLERAAEQALRNYANIDAIRYVDKAFDLAASTGAAVENRRKSTWETIRGDAYHELADFDEASSHYARALDLLGYRPPSRSVALLRDILGGALRQLALRIMPAHPEALSELRRQKFQQVAHIYERLSEEYFFLNDSFLVLNGTLASLNLAERCGSVAEAIGGYNALALGLGMCGLVRAAHSYNRRALWLAGKSGELPELARAHLVGGVLAAGLGEWDFADRCAEQATALFHRLGDRARWQTTKTMAIFVALLGGKLAAAEDLLAELWTTISVDSSTQVRAWSLCARVFIDTVRGNVDAAVLKELRALADAKQARADALLCLGILSMAYERCGDFERANEAATRGLAVLGQCSIVWAAYSYGAAGVAETLLARWERASRDETRDPGLQATAQLASRLLDRVARTSPVCRPRALLIRGRVALLSGRPARARRQWQRAAHVANKLRMPYEVGLSLYAIGRSTREEADRKDNIKRAAEIFETLGAVDDLTRTKRALSG